MNISYEDCERLGINNLDDMNSEGTKSWFLEQSYKGLELLQKHKETKGNFGLLTRITLPVVFESPARRYFKNVTEFKP